MQLTVRQHYLPQTYLRSWADTSGKLKVHNKLNGKNFCPAPESVFVESNFYEDPTQPPTNELEKKFGLFETAFGPACKFLQLLEQNALLDRQPVSDVLASALNSLPERLSTIRSFAATAYFRTPTALANMKEQLAADKSAGATQALQELDSPYELSVSAFESSLLPRFNKLGLVIMHSPYQRLDTGDCFCFPVIGGENHANFGYDIGRHEAAFAALPLTPSIALIFLPNPQNTCPLVIGREMPRELALKLNHLVHEKSSRLIVRG
jgi:hypothetical protein